MTTAAHLTPAGRCARPAAPRTVPPPRREPAAGVDPAAAREFLEQFHAETRAGHGLHARVDQVLAEIDATGTYRHTSDELGFGARVAWRNSARCIGRLYWNGLHVRDRRTVTGAREIAEECVAHLRHCTRGGRIRSTITVFAPDGPDRRGPRIHNEQLIRYAGHRRPDGSVWGDPRGVAMTDEAIGLGWVPPAERGRFDVLPLVVTDGQGERVVHPLPSDAVLEVPLHHPEHAWFGDLGLRWHAVPAISDMTLVIGGVHYPAAPFNGYYMGTEIGARNLADVDRYDQLPVVARGLGLDTSSDRTLWKDRALVELVRAVHHSFDEAGVSLADHHGESERFLLHVAREERAGRTCPADWSWIVPPMSGSTTRVFHRYYAEPDPTSQPAFLPRASAPPRAGR
ncbi:nitric oxide synthase oxygenase [Pseudonocardia sp. WMMC193]|uniref:nitric oxide synthase oxygenase n=1 Tax=Pseudonocardia sp. WMMC193 TaxID=2911965 RepID=UPI001F1FE7D9|nr:nitric oxide synthase oxygenase [Pseudonocardia sp. WMMC193]MCF7548349.1 nitric oxide synthase oxygenase [Pseudonocardia sp. WMMC193]